MIVTIAAWLYIVDAMLMLGSLLWSPWGFNGIEGLMTLAFAGLVGAMGMGLLKRLPWARWLALGASLVGWVLGSVLLLVGISFLSVGAPALLYLLFAGGIFSFIGILAIVAVLFWLVSIVISYKLFWFLCSEQGCAHFGVPHESTQTVIASSATWVAIFILNAMASGSGQSMSALMARGSGEPPAAVSKPAARQAVPAAVVDESPVPSDEADPPEEADDPSGENYSIEESPVPAVETSTADSEDSEDEAPMQILKCIDASGGTIFTQGYCPPGSKPARTAAK